MAALTDVDVYPEWNPHVAAAEGTVGPNERLRLTVRTGGRERTIPVRVTAFDPPRRLERVGRVGHRAPFEGRHAFELTPLDGDRDYGRMNDALAARIERERDA